MRLPIDNPIEGSEQTQRTDAEATDLNVNLPEVAIST